MLPCQPKKQRHECVTLLLRSLSVPMSHTERTGNGGRGGNEWESEKNERIGRKENKKAKNHRPRHQGDKRGRWIPTRFWLHRIRDEIFYLNKTSVLRSFFVWVCMIVSVLLLSLSPSVHQNYVGTDAEKNPFYLSVVLSDQNNQRVPQYRAILWRKTVSSPFAHRVEQVTQLKVTIPQCKKYSKTSQISFWHLVTLWSSFFY